MAPTHGRNLIKLSISFGDLELSRHSFRKLASKLYRNRKNQILPESKCLWYNMNCRMYPRSMYVPTGLKVKKVEYIFWGDCRHD